MRMSDEGALGADANAVVSAFVNLPFAGEKGSEELLPRSGSCGGSTLARSRSCQITHPATSSRRRGERPYIALTEPWTARLGHRPEPGGARCAAGRAISLKGTLPIRVPIRSPRQRRIVT